MKQVKGIYIPAEGKPEVKEYSSKEEIRSDIGFETPYSPEGLLFNQDSIVIHDPSAGMSSLNYGPAPKKKNLIATALFQTILETPLTGATPYQYLSGDVVILGPIIFNEYSDAPEDLIAVLIREGR